MRLLIPSIISKHTVLDVNGLKSDWALYKVWHIAAKLSHETNLAITKWPFSLIHNTIGLGLPMFINATTRQTNFNIFNRPLLIFACLYPTFGKVGYNLIFFARSARESCFVVVPHLKIHSTAHVNMSTPVHPMGMLLAAGEERVDRNVVDRKE